MVVRELIRETESELRENARFEAELIVMRAAGLSRTELITLSRREVTDEETKNARTMTERRKSGEPLQYILGETEFMSLGFYVEKGVLIPRPDTETLVESVLREIKEDEECKILDVCAGSGCVGISLAHYRQNITVDLVDISDTALRAAKKNAERNNVKERVRLIKRDILTERLDGAYDIIVSNPPYIETDVIETLQTEVRDYEPRLALDGGSDGLTFYREITKAAQTILKNNGLLVFEIGCNQGAAVSEIMKKRFTDVQIIKDLSGNDRVVKGVLL